MVIDEERFWDKVERLDDGCWLWTASTYGHGYGQFGQDGRKFAAHRIAYELLVGPIPQGLVLDHLCRVRHCVNPAHLRPCTNRENVLAEGSLSVAKRRAEQKTCAAGHPFDEINTYLRGTHRYCRPCRAEREREYRARKVAA